MPKNLFCFILFSFFDSCDIFSLTFPKYRVHTTIKAKIFTTIVNTPVKTFLSILDVGLVAAFAVT